MSLGVLLLVAGPAPAVENTPPEAAPTSAPAPSLLVRPKLKTITPPAEAEKDAAIARGVAFLLKAQNKDGSWGSPRRTKGLNIYAPVPGAHHAFRAATTALCIAALHEAGGRSDAARQALERAESWLLEHLPRLRRATPRAIYNVWGHAYAIQALVRMLEPRPPEDPQRREIVSLIEDQIGFLDRYESVDGGWGYYDFRAHTRKPSSRSTSFVNATVLVAFHEARGVGVEPPQKLVRRATAAIRRQRKPDFSYLYSEAARWRPMHPINRHGGSLGRSQVCNLALRLWADEKITDEVLKAWLSRLFARNLWLEMGRKRPIPHESWFAVAGYFFYYGHYYAALCIDQLQPADRPQYQDHLAHILLRLQEKDGSWWDYPLYDYHQPYGTAFALMSLKRCRKENQN